MTDAVPDFSPLAERYARARPSYPDELYAWLAGLVDRREGNGAAANADDAHAADLLAVLAHSPRRHGQRRPTWTQELMIKVMCRRGHPAVSTTTIGRLLRRLGVRRGMAKPTAGCPWGRRRKAASSQC